MRIDLLHAGAVPLPHNTSVRRAYALPFLADAYAIELPAGATTDPERLARFVFGGRSPAVRRLMRLRDLLVAGLGLKTARRLEATNRGSADRISIFKVYERHAHEIVMGEDDSHLDFRLSVLCQPEAGPAHPPRLVASTVVHCHNRLGRSYIRVIAPFHRWVVKSSLRRAARAGWPGAAR